MRTISTFCKKFPAVLSAAIAVSVLPVGLVLTGCCPNPSTEKGGTAVSADIFTYKVGNVEVSLLCERQQEASPGILIGATPEILQRTAPNGTFPNAINAFLIKFPTSGEFPFYTLVDTGFGTKLFDNLKTLNVKPEEINSIFLTHMHGDHIGGLLHADGSLAFPKTFVYLTKAEHDYWISLAAGKETQQSKVIAAYKKDERLMLYPNGEDLNNEKARASLVKPLPINNPKTPVIIDSEFYKINSEFYKKDFLVYKKTDDSEVRDESKLIKGTTTNERRDEDVLISLIPTPGHTPGHTAYLIRSKDERLLIWGDLAHAMAVQMPYPQVSVTYDVDPVQAAKSRRLVLDFITENNIPVAGMHIAYPGMGIVTKDKEVPSGYKFEAFKPNKK